MPAVYKKMHEALVATGRPIVYSLCEYGMDRVWQWGPSVGGNLWRTTDDIEDNYTRMAFIGFGQQGLARFAGPGHWNDPDMLEVGNGHMNPDEYRTHMSLWCILAAPLISGNDLSSMSQETLAMLTNPEVVAVDQDPAGKEGYRLSQEGPLQVWVKPLADGSRAVGLFNEGESTMPVSVRFKDIGLSGEVSVRDLWQRKDTGVFSGSYTAQVPRHGVVMLKLQSGS
jgi:alpha-galactosidase